MKRALQIVSISTLVTVFAALVAQVLTVTWGIYYNPNGLPVNPSTLTQVVLILGVVGILALPLTAVNFVFGIVVAGLEQRYIWIVVLLVAAVLVGVGLFAMIWILLSVQSPIAFQALFVIVPLVTLAYTLAPVSRRTVASSAV
jgi:hypothetical protein